ncbi:glycosyltransferase [Candidatus Micrarchaeota archaeon]|nr:glycosyltransferase [Candidatus Micrarchaeota archaeon]
MKVVKFTPIKKRVIHIYDRPWPIDKKFYGQAFSIANHTTYSQYPISVRSFYDHTPLLEDLEIRAAKVFFNAEYRGNKFVIKNLKEDLYNFFAENECPVLVFQTHKNIDIVNGIKRKIGKRIKTVFVLNCRPDVYGFVYNGDKTTKGSLFTNIPFDAYVAVSRTVKEDYIKLGLPPSKIEEIQNGVSLKVYKPMDPNERSGIRETLGINTRFVVGYSGRITKDKGYDILVELLNLFEEDNQLFKDFSFLFALSGDKRDQFIKEVSYRFPKLTRSGRIKIVVDIAKYVNGSDEDLSNIALLNEIKSYLLDEENLQSPLFKGIVTKPIQAISDVLILPSYSESFSYSVLEALAVGTPVVTLDSGGPAELVKNIGGYLIDLEGITHLDGHLHLSKDKVVEVAKSFAEGIMKAIDDIHTNPRLKEEFILAVRKSGRTAKDMAKKLDELVNML